MRHQIPSNQKRFSHFRIKWMSNFPHLESSFIIRTVIPSSWSILRHSITPTRIRFRKKNSFHLESMFMTIEKSLYKLNQSSIITAKYTTCPVISWIIIPIGLTYSNKKRGKNVKIFCLEASNWSWFWLNVFSALNTVRESCFVLFCFVLQLCPFDNRPTAVVNEHGSQSSSESPHVQSQILPK